MRRNKYIMSVVIVVLATLVASAMALAPGTKPELIAALSGIAVAAATLVLAIVTAAAVEETRAQARLAQRAPYRPSLVPQNVPNLSAFDADDVITIPFGNAGHGAAFKVTGLLSRRDPDSQVPRKLMVARYSDQIPPSANDRHGLHFLVSELVPQSEPEIGGFPLQVPAGPHRARLVVSYTDIFGTQYGSIFDLWGQATWKPIVTLEDIRLDVDDLFPS